MSKIYKTAISFLFLFLIVLTFSPSAKAQGAVVYRFLEVVDYADKPVANAKVTTIGFGVRSGELKTNEKGQLERGMPISVGDFTTTGFTVSKDGYFSFTDIYGITTINRDKIKIELLIKSTDDRERKIVGGEQSKREFFMAARAGDFISVRRFLESGLDPNITTFELRGVPAPIDKPIMLFAIESGSGKTVNEFLKAGIDISNNKKLYGDILADYLNKYPSQQNYPDTDAGKRQKFVDYDEGVKALIEAGANINSNDGNSISPLMIATDKRYVGIVKLLVEKGVSINAKDNYGRTALMYLIKYYKAKERIEIANMLIRAGAEVNFITNNIAYAEYRYNSCSTPLTYAVQGSDTELVKIFLANGADVNLTCKGGKTALGYAKDLSPHTAKENKKIIIEILESAGAN